jgi:hypothetical protein
MRVLPPTSVAVFAMEEERRLVPTLDLADYRGAERRRATTRNRGHENQGQAKNPLAEERKNGLARTRLPMYKKPLATDPNRVPGKEEPCTWKRGTVYLEKRNRVPGKEEPCTWKRGLSGEGGH